MTYGVYCSGAVASVWLHVCGVRAVYMFSLLVFGMYVRFVRV